MPAVPKVTLEWRAKRGAFLSYTKRVLAMMGERVVGDAGILSDLERPAGAVDLLLSGHITPFGVGEVWRPGFVPLAPEAVVLAQQREVGEAGVEQSMTVEKKEDKVWIWEDELARGEEARRVRVSPGSPRGE